MALMSQMQMILLKLLLEEKPPQQNTRANENSTFVFGMKNHTEIV